MSADTRPIAPAAFAAALKDLSTGMLHLKVLEIRNSIAHLQFSNDQLKPFAEGSATAISDSSAGAGPANEPDQDCVDAIKENEAVIDRMAERIALIRAEVEDRGQSWTEFQSKDEIEAPKEGGEAGEAGEAVNGEANGHASEASRSTARAASVLATPHAAWSDGTFQIGTIRNGQIELDGEPTPQGGTLSDEQLRAALEERMRNLGTEDDTDDGGMHL